MSCQKPISVCQTALLLSTKLQYETIIQVQARARIPEIRSISDLHTEHIVPKIWPSAQGNYRHVFDITSQQFTFTHFPFTTIKLTIHFTVLHTPQSTKNPNPIKNVALQKFVGSSTITWFGNMLIIAHVPSGMPVPFTSDLVDSVRVLLVNLLHLQTVKDVLKYAQWRVYRPLGEVPIAPERNSFTHTVFPNEMLLEIFEKCDTRSLAALSASSSGMWTMVRASLFTVVCSTLLPFLLENKIAEFFDCLADVKGIVLGTLLFVFNSGQIGC
ncbi:hypothetical protein BDN71DRAFT_1431195 [Pleurotus eryngii]|uniref:F-box domain-containing protein n=1 Tax=Pleurotus eryngii TaxID=5323 RepID=A0A9P5ZW57_PLEER|nr:hypothetical protein BDN71DRAFT_1431195 [Pleurotus eryngii]